MDNCVGLQQLLDFYHKMLSVLIILVFQITLEVCRLSETSLIKKESHSFQLKFIFGSVCSVFIGLFCHQRAKIIGTVCSLSAGKLKKVGQKSLDFSFLNKPNSISEIFGQKYRNKA